MTEALAAFNLVFLRPTKDKQAIASVILNSMNVRRLIFLNTSCQDKHTYDSAILVVNASDGDLRMLSQPVTEIGGIALKVLKISLEEAEWAIDQKRTKIYVGNIPYPTDNETLWRHFAKYGTLDYTYIVKKPTKSGQKGFGYVIYKDRASLEHALSIKHFLHGVKLNCKIFLNKGKLKRRVGEEGEDQDEAGCTDYFQSCENPPKGHNQQHYRHVHHHHHVISSRNTENALVDSGLERELYCEDESHEHIHGPTPDDVQPVQSGSMLSFKDHTDHETATSSLTKTRKPLRLSSNQNAAVFAPKSCHENHGIPLQNPHYHQHCAHVLLATPTYPGHLHAVHSPHHHCHEHDYNNHHNDHNQHQMHHNHSHQAHWVHVHHQPLLPSVLSAPNKLEQPRDHTNSGHKHDAADTDSLHSQSFDESLTRFDTHCWHQSHSLETEDKDKCADSDVCSDDHCEDLLCLGEICGFNDPKVALEEHIKKCGALGQNKYCSEFEHHRDCPIAKNTKESEETGCLDKNRLQDCCPEDTCQTLYQACETNEKGQCEFQRHLKSKLIQPFIATNSKTDLFKEEPTVVCCWDTHREHDESHCEKHEKCTSTGAHSHVGCIGQVCTINNCSYGPRMKEMKSKQSADKNKVVLNGKFRKEYKPLF